MDGLVQCIGVPCEYIFNEAGESGVRALSVTDERRAGMKKEFPCESSVNRLASCCGMPGIFSGWVGIGLRDVGLGFARR